MPGQKFMDARDGHVGQPGEDIGKPGLWVDVVHFGRDDEGIHGGRSLTAALGTREEPRLSAQGHAAQGAFGRIIRQADAPVIEECRERFPT
jgi:hypothetical protein